MSGGFREGSGRKNPWASQTRKEDCKSIRVPANIVDRLMQVAHYIDAGGDVNLDTKDINTENNQMTELDKLTLIIKEFKLQSKPNSRDWKKVDKLIAEIETKLNLYIGDN